MHLQDKITLMCNSARFDVCEEDIFYNTQVLGNTVNKPPPPNKVPKVFMTNKCVFDCQYCGCRRSFEQREDFVLTPKELADIAVRGASANSNGIFLTSAILKSPDYTQELINRTCREIRLAHGYKGYLHAKVMPGADSRLIYEAGLLADRLSVNIELPHSSGYETIARQKTKENILGPMGVISNLIKEHGGRNFARTQCTQIMVGTMLENDRTIMTLTEAMYKKYGLKRVYYAPFTPIQETDVLPSARTPHWRRNRLYQADRLVALYGMSTEELVPGSSPFLDRDIDPKAAWALRNLGQFPVEVNTADYEMLLRVPGIGITGAKRILTARKVNALTPEHLKKMRISLKYGMYFMTFKGRYYGGSMRDSEWLKVKLLSKPVKPEQLKFDLI